MNNDLISRQQAFNELHRHFADGFEEDRWWNSTHVIAALKGLPPAQPEQQHGRIFQEIVVEYPSYNTYPEYKGKPYFSIKYTENGQEFIGYGTYKPEVLSKYLKEYFMPSAQPERNDALEKAVAVEAISDELMSRFDISATYAYEVAETAVNRIEVMAKEMERGEDG